jgi:hypothetical protein
VRRLFWFSAGAAAGYYVARRGERFVVDARERGLVGNVSLAADAATRLAHSASQAAVTLGERSRAGAATVDLTDPNEGRT